MQRESTEQVRRGLFSAQVEQSDLPKCPDGLSLLDPEKLSQENAFLWRLVAKLISYNERLRKSKGGRPRKAVKAVGIRAILFPKRAGRPMLPERHMYTGFLQGMLVLHGMPARTADALIARAEAGDQGDVPKWQEDLLNRRFPRGLSWRDRARLVAHLEQARREDD